jgi:hypothetical protein
MAGERNKRATQWSCQIGNVVLKTRQGQYFPFCDGRDYRGEEKITEKRHDENELFIVPFE